MNQYLVQKNSCILPVVKLTSSGVNSAGSKFCDYKTIWQKAKIIFML